MEVDGTDLYWPTNSLTQFRTLIFLHHTDIIYDIVLLLNSLQGIALGGVSIKQGQYRIYLEKWWVSTQSVTEPMNGKRTDSVQGHPLPNQ